MSRARDIANLQSGGVINVGSVDLDFRIESNGNANMLFVDGGNDRVGIGVGDPDHKLEILGGNGNQLKLNNGSERFTQAVWSSNDSMKGTIFYDSTNTDFVVNTQASVDLVMQTGGSSERMRITSAGKVGIGTTSVDGSNKLQVEETTANTAAGIKIQSASWDAILTLTTGSNSWEIGNDYSNSASLNFYNTQTASVALMLDSLSNVGIGGAPVATDAAYNTASLHLRQEASNKGSQIHFTNAATGDAAGNGAHISLWTDDDLYITNQESDGQIKFASGGNSDALKIDSNGNLIVGNGVSHVDVNTGPDITIGSSGNGDTDGSAIGFVHNGSNLNAYIGGQKQFLTMGTYTSTPFRLITANTERMRISSSGAVTKPTHPAFQARPSSVQTNVAVNTTTTIAFGTEIFDLNGNFASNTFTAPVTGKYQLSSSIFMQHINTDYSYLEIIITTSNRTYINQISPSGLNIDNNASMSVNHSVLADMDASDTAIITINLPNNGSAQLDIHTYSSFSGYLVA